MMHNSVGNAVTLSVRVSPQVKEELEKLADATGRTKSFLTAEAIQRYLELEAWQIKAIKKAVAHAKTKKAKFVDHEKIVKWLTSWGNSIELEPPQ